MLSEVQKISGVPIDILKSEIRKVHQKHGTSEYAFLLEELPSLQRFCDGENVNEVFKPAIEKFRVARGRSLRLYPTVSETLDTLASRRVKIVAFTESMAFYTNYRIRKLSLDERINILFSPRDHDLPRGLSADDLRKYPAVNYTLKRTTHKYTPKGKFKPDVNILKAIIEDIGISSDECVYVGDSLHKDIAMAEDLGIDHAWAKYGVAQKRPEYELLREVTHWSDIDVEREREVANRTVKPSIVLERTFSEILDNFDFGNNHYG